MDESCPKSLQDACAKSPGNWQDYRKRRRSKCARNPSADAVSKFNKVIDYRFYRLSNTPPVPPPDRGVALLARVADQRVAVVKAEHGEVTRQAFANGRMGLTQGGRLAARAAQSTINPPSCAR